MSFETVDPWIRVLLFGGIFAGGAGLAWWALTVLGPGLRQLAIACLALATIPALVIAPADGGSPLLLAGLVAVAAFLTSAVLTLIPELRGGTQDWPLETAIAPAGAGALAFDSPTRVAGQAPTAVLDQTSSHQTAALGTEALPQEIAFLVEFSGDGRPHRLGFDTRIGRGAGQVINLTDEGVSREHARIKLEDHRFVLYDLGATNGTRLVRAGRRRRIAAPVPLRDLDMIELGAARLVFLSVDTPER